ncbi:MAG: hypothetical protein ACRDSP_22390 [Pseudonocardiaceae bacterium]
MIDIRVAIALWMIDSDYDEESFFVRHRYFSGGGTDPYARLKRALRTEIGPQAWTRSMAPDRDPSPRQRPTRSQSR